MSRGGKRPGSGRKKGSIKPATKQKISLWIEKDLLFQIDNIAKNRTKFIIEACKKYMEGMINEKE